MDNLAHTLVGAALGRAVAGRELPAAGWIGAIMGNAPDWAELVLRPSSWAPRAGVGYLVYHRGITHSVLGAAIEIVILIGLVGLMLHLRTGREVGNPLPWRWSGVATCVTVTVASHLYLDWQGSYGLRPFLPWSGEWYYADWVAIVDPFFWVVPLVALAWGARRHWAPALLYGVTLIGVTTLVLWRGNDLVVWWVRLAIVGGAAAGVVGWTRHWFGVAGRRRAAAYGLLALAAYTAANAWASAVAKAEARATATRRFGPDARWAALTLLGRPFRWEAIAASADSVAGPGWVIPRRLDHPAVRTALATPEGRAMVQFARFLAAAVDSSAGDMRVSLWDARYHAPGSGAHGWAAVHVRLRGRG
jgi:inner membrane protein